MPHIPKDARYTLGAKIDRALIEAIELLFAASYLGKKQKLPYLQKANTRFDLVKFLLQILWEIKALDNSKYVVLSEKFDEIGKMLGGWLRKMSA